MQMSLWILWLSAIRFYTWVKNGVLLPKSLVAWPKPTVVLPRIYRTEMGLKMHLSTLDQLLLVSHILRKSRSMDGSAMAYVVLG